MKSSKRTSLFLIGMSLVTFAAFVGSTTGTLAWYAYSTRVSMSYTGTSVSATEQLQIGIHDPQGYITSEMISTNHYERDDSTDIVWAPAGVGFTAAVTTQYLSNRGCSTALIDGTTYANCLTPVTSKERALNSTSALSLFAAPQAGYTINATSANTKYYSVIPFAFRVIDGNDNYLGDKKVWISDAKAITSGAARIHESLRIFTRDPNATSTHTYLFNPSKANSGSNVVAGMLDLDGDGYYDREYRNAEHKYYEIIYGEGSYSGYPIYSDTAAAADSGMDDINQTNASEATTFYAKHQSGTYTTSYNGLTMYEAHYYGYNDMRPEVDEGTGAFINGKPVTITDSTTKIGYSTLTIYLEGWDHSVIDQAIGYQFNLGLTFEIDRV